MIFFTSPPKPLPPNRLLESHDRAYRQRKARVISFGVLGGFAQKYSSRQGAKNLMASNK
jgi:hypothetical protein